MVKYVEWYCKSCGEHYRSVRSHRGHCPDCGYGNYGKLYKNKEWLEEQIFKEDFSINDIAKRCGVSYRTISHWVNKFEIELKD